MVVGPPRRAMVLIAAALACLVAGPSAVSVAVSRPVAATGPPLISLSVPAEPGSKAVIVAKGRVTPAPAHGRIVLQFRKGGSWQALGSGPVR